MKSKKQPKPALAAVAGPTEPTLDKFIEENTPENWYNLRWQAYAAREDPCELNIELTEAEYQDLLRHLGQSRGYAAVSTKAAA